MIFRAALGTAAVLASTSTIWAAAEYRRANCVEERKVGCTLLPWSGERAPLSPEEEALIETYGGGR